MPFIETPIAGLIIFEPKVWGDDRGYFYESYNRQTFENVGIHAEFVQDNQSFSSYGVLRGLHYQLPPFAQAKLVRAQQGKVLDVAVDIREGSPTYGQSFSIILDDEKKQQLFIPRGFAHGFVVLSDTAVFSYKCDNFYSKENEAGIQFNDPHFGIDWKVDEKDMVLSEKDKLNPLFGEHKIFSL